MSKLYIAIVVLIFLLSGCNKVTKENYDKIKMGMSYNEVVQLIGTPEGCLEALGISSCAWENGASKVDIKFVSDQVIFITGDALK